MNKQQIMEFLSKAIDEGAGIQIIINGFKLTDAEAKARCQEFSQIVGAETEDVNFSNSHWYRVWGKQFKLDHFYDSEYMKEDVDLTGKVS